MKTEFVDVSDTRKKLVIEIPADVVEGEFDRRAREQGHKARVPGFRPGKVPVRIVRQRYKDLILHDLAEALIPRAIDEALAGRGIEPVDMPHVDDMSLDEGQPLRFTASFDTVPEIDPGPYEQLEIRRPVVTVDEGEVDRTLEQLREQASRYEPVEGRAVEPGDTVVVDLTRQVVGPDSQGDPERHQNVTVELGAAVNPPGFDAEVIGLEVGAEKNFQVQYPSDFSLPELAGKQMRFDLVLRAIRRRIVPNLDDEFAKDLGEFDTIGALRARVADDLHQEAVRESDRRVRAELLEQLASKVTFEVPESLIEREIDRRVQGFLHRLIEQRVDPRRANIDWEEFRKNQREPALATVKSTLVVDQVARREQIAVTGEELDREVAAFASRTGRTPAAVRAELEKEGGLARLAAGLRRDRAIDFLMARATIAGD